MSAAAPKLFLTGDPGCGKTTAIRGVVQRLRGVVMTGFFTEEIRERGVRQGFRGVTLDGRTFRLAHTDVKGSFRVGKYGVDVASLDAVGVAALETGPDTQLVVLDEVGKMECFSPTFRDAVTRLLDGPVPVLGTVAAHGVGFPKRVRQDPRVTLVRMSRDSREAVVTEIVRRLARDGVTPRERGGGPAGRPKPLAGGRD